MKKPGVSNPKKIYGIHQILEKLQEHLDQLELTKEEQSSQEFVQFLNQFKFGIDTLISSEQTKKLCVLCINATFKEMND